MGKPWRGKYGVRHIWRIDDCSVVNGMVQVCLDRKKVAEKLDKVLAKNGVMPYFIELCGFRAGRVRK